MFCSRVTSLCNLKKTGHIFQFKNARDLTSLIPIKIADDIMQYALANPHLAPRMSRLALFYPLVAVIIFEPKQNCDQQKRNLDTPENRDNRTFHIRHRRQILTEIDFRQGGFPGLTPNCLLQGLFH